MNSEFAPKSPGDLEKPKKGEYRPGVRQRGEGAETLARLRARRTEQQTESLDLKEYREFATELAREAGKIMKQNFTLGMGIEWKEDDTPLTVTDTQINQLVLDRIAGKYPEHSVIAEEGSRIKESECTWVCDPIDGTMPFSKGYPTFVFSLSLMQGGEVLMGVIYDPIMDRFLSAEKGKGAYLNGSRVSVSDEQTLSRTSFLNWSEPQILPALHNMLVKTGCRVASLFSAQYSSLLVAAGSFVGSIYADKKPWDGAAVKIIVEEAGGKVTDLDGNEQRYDRPINGCVASNGKVHGELLEILKKARAEKAG